MCNSSVCGTLGAKDLHQCRDDNDDQDFTIEPCPCGQVIHIRSAVVGFNGIPKQCSLTQTTCIRIITNYPQITSCNGNSTCTIPRDVLCFSPPDKLCDDHQNGTAIDIIYDCINPGNLYFLYLYNHSYYAVLNSLRLYVDFSTV